MLSAAPRFLPFSTHQISWLSRSVLIHCDLDLVDFKVPLFNIQFWLLRCLDFLQRAAQVSENQSEVAKSPRSDRILFSENLSSAHAFIIYVLHCNLNIAINDDDDNDYDEYDYVGDDYDDDDCDDDYWG